MRLGSIVQVFIKVFEDDALALLQNFRVIFSYLLCCLLVLGEHPQDRKRALFEVLALTRRQLEPVLNHVRHYSFDELLRGLKGTSGANHLPPTVLYRGQSAQYLDHRFVYLRVHVTVSLLLHDQELQYFV